MKEGNWVPLRKGYLFPKHREFSEIEAAYSLQLDFDNGNDFTIAGMAANWKWSETKVRNFLLTLGAEIEYPETTSRNKRGKLIPSKRRMKEEWKENKERMKEDIKLFCFGKMPSQEKNEKRMEEEWKENKAQATINPNPNNKENNIVPYDEIVDLYNSICTSLSKVRDLTDGRKKLIAARWKKHNSLEIFHEAFTIAENTPFLRGKNDSGWKANFDFIIKESSFAKILEGFYGKQLCKEQEQPSYV